ncbi:hypothetical protein I4U23_030059 [Adineta vaga]|nr:hypothetical protein I4U23_030059 [Adineta vaga]
MKRLSRHLRSIKTTQAYSGLLPPVKPWRRIESGASLLGMCTNPECNAHRKEVIIPLGFKTYDIVVDPSSLARCPICTTYVNISKLGFNRCQWRLHGIRQQNSTSPPMPFLHERTQAPRHSLIEYNLKENETVWRQLILETISEN